MNSVLRMRYLGSSRKTGFDEQKPEVSLRYYTDVPDRQLIQRLCYFLNFVMFVTIAFSILNKYSFSCLKQKVLLIL